MDLAKDVSRSVEAVSERVRDGACAVVDGTLRVGRGATCGFLAGLAAVWIMKQYAQIESRPVNVRRAEQQRAQAEQQEPQRSQQSSSQQQQQEGQGKEQPTVKVAQHVSRHFFGHELTESEKQIAGPVVQYGYGALTGALFGGLAELFPTVAIGLGIPYATLMWLLGSETALPVLGLDEPPTSKSGAEHASGMAMHFVYGISLDVLRRVLRFLY